MNERVAVTDAKAYIDEMDEKEKKKKTEGARYGKFRVITLQLIDAMTCAADK